MAATTTTNPSGKPTSSPITPIYNPLIPAPLAKSDPLRGPTYPTISITTSFATANAVKLEFEYLPESVSFGVNATFDQQPITFTSARWLSYQNSDIEEVSLNVKVVAGCNNCITRFGGNIKGNIKIKEFLKFGGLVTAKYERNSLIIIAKLLYSLPLPGTNNYFERGGKATPPPTCRLIIGRMFSGVGAFTGCSIAFNGPYDFDGSPTDMDVSLRFLPSEFYDSTSFEKMIEAGAALDPKSTPTGESQVTGQYPYALTFGETSGGLAGQPGIGVNAPPIQHPPQPGPVPGPLPGPTPAPRPGPSPTLTSSTITLKELQIPKSKVQGP